MLDVDAAVKKPLAFDSRWRAATPALHECAEQLLVELTQFESNNHARTRARKPADAAAWLLTIESIACNLLASRLIASGAAIAVRRESGASSHSRIFGAGFNRALDYGSAMGLWEPTTGFRVSIHCNGLSTIRMLPGHQMFAARLSWSDFVVTKEASIMLRDIKDEAGNAGDIAFEETDETRRLVRDMDAINDWLQSLPVTLDGAQAWTVPTECGRMQRIVTTMHHTRLQRIFNNATFAQGGRLFGGWWQTLSKSDRRHRIRIAGQPVIEADFHALFIRLAYIALGEPWPFADDDPYVVNGDGTRSGWKVLTNSLLFATQPLKAWPGEGKEARDELRSQFGVQFKAAIAAIKDKHPRIAHHGGFERGLGHALSRLESDFMVTLLLTCRAASLPALPVHDCIVVPECEGNRAASLMRDIASMVYKRDMPVTLS